MISAGRLIQVEYPGDKVVSYEYDEAGNRTKLTYPDNSYITYEYDQLNRLTKIRNQVSTILASYTYDVRSRRTNLSYANGTTIGYRYDTASRLLSIDNQTGPGPVQYKYAYTYDKVGNRLSMLFNDSEEHIYCYDQTYQVTDVNYPTSYSWIDDTTFNYDDASNRTSVINGGTVDYLSNELNQYSSVGGVYYDYDQNGNLTYDATCFYSYDAENRLTEVTRATGGGTGPLSAALDTDLSFTTGGDANWAPTTAEYYYGGDSAQSGENGSSWLEMTVIGEGTLKFWEKVSGGNYCFSVDGRIIYVKSYCDWWHSSGNITGLGPHTLKWSYSGDGTAWVDYVQWTSTSEPVQSLQEALDVGWPIVTGGDADWSKVSYPAYNDGDSAKSGNIGNNKVSQMQAKVEGEGMVTFWWKVSSEEDCDYLKFYIDGVFKHEISGNVDWQQKQYNLTGSGSHSLLWQYSKDSGTAEGSDCGWVDWLQGPGTAPPPPDPFAGALDCDLSFTTGGNREWEANTLSGYYGGDSARNGLVGDEEESWLQTTVEGEGTITFWWKVYSEQGDYLEFYIDSVLKDQIDGWVDWEPKQYNISGSGSHTLKWRYIKDSEYEDGDDRGSVDWLQWSGSPPPDPTEWDTITYTYDPAGRRIKKNVDGSYIVKYVYDGDHVIAEYDGSNNLLRKYIYGARVDEPVCMLDVADNNAAYYYHFDGLGSVVALSNSYGNSCQSYEYSIYGQVAASDPNFLANPYMFTGRRFDIETGLYYYRARYYNPHIGRFMQTDPVGYSAGINWYLYCNNNPLSFVDPSGLASFNVNIPESCITIFGERYEENAFSDVYAWLDSVGFFFEHKDWYINYGDVTLEDGVYNVTFTSDVCDVCAPSFQSFKVGGVNVVGFDMLVFLDDRTLNDIIRPTIETINEWSPWNPYNFVRLMDLDSPFKELFSDPDLRFRYRGEKAKACEINYIVQGHAHQHMKLTRLQSKELVFLHNWGFLPIGSIIALSPGRQTPTWTEFKNKLMWTAVGYSEYNNRKDW